MTSITIQNDDGTGPSIVIGVPVPVGAGEANTMVDAGANAHESIVATPPKINEAIQAKGLRAGAGITLTDNPTDKVIEISASGAQSASSLGSSQTALTAFQTKAQLVTTPLTGTFELQWNAIGQNNDVAGEYRLFNVTDGVVVGGADAVLTVTSRSGGQFFVGGTGEVIFTGAPKTFEIQWRDVTSGQTQTILAARVSIREFA